MPYPPLWSVSLLTFFAVRLCSALWYMPTQFTNCHLEKSGLQTYECTDAMDIVACTRPMVDSVNSIAYSAYTTFYTHAESMCFYLQSEAFQRATENAVDALHASARGTAAQLGELQIQATHVINDTKAIRSEQAAAAEAAQALLAGQRVASAELGELSAKQTAAFDRAESSIQQLGGESQAALAEIKRGADEIGSKQGVLLGGLDRILSLQGSVLGEVCNAAAALARETRSRPAVCAVDLPWQSWLSPSTILSPCALIQFLDIKSVFFYFCAVLLALALTATHYTAAARLPIFAMLTANLTLERLLAAYVFPPAASTGSVESLHYWFGLVRRFTTTLAAAALGYAALHHTDVGKKTLSALDELKKMCVPSRSDPSHCRRCVLPLPCSLAAGYN